MLLQSQQLLVVVLLLSIATASYPFKAVKRIDELKIPFCIDQVGYRCHVCGYDDEKKTFTSPNAFMTACLPQVNGCQQYADLKGQVCNTNTGCGCGFSKNQLGTECVPTPAGLENCAVLSRSGTSCDECVSYTATSNTGGLGGGFSDYGKSSDSKKCIDNTVLNKPNCKQYQTGDTECAVCKDGFAFNSTGVCIRLRDQTETNCQLANDDGICIRCFINAPWDAATGQCKLNTSQASNCAAFLKLSNGLDDQTTCIQCKPGYIITKTGCQTVPTNSIALDGTSLGGQESTYGRWCLGLVQTFMGKYACAIPLAKRADYNKGLITTPSIVTTVDGVDTLCNSAKVDITDLSCPSSADCYTSGNSGLVYQTNTKTCRKISDILSFSNNCEAVKFCKIADTYGFCKECYDGYTKNPVDGVCRAVASELLGCREANEDKVTCKTCETNFVSVDSSGNYIRRNYRLNKLTGRCVQLTVSQQISWCLTYDDATLLCTKCQDGYEIVDGMCFWKGPVETPVGQYGCQTYDTATNKCTAALPGFTCDAAGYYCWENDLAHNCLKFSTTGQCEVCIAPDYFKVYDDVTKQFSQCSNSATGKYDNVGCAQRSSLCGDCDECKNTYSKVTRDGTNPDGRTDTGCYRSAASTGSEGVPGCVKHSGNDACEVCGFGFVLTADNKCFDLYDRRTSSNTLGYLTGALSSLIPEPCKEQPTTNVQCSECDAPAGADVGLKQFASALFSDAKARAFCIYNTENTSIRLTSGGATITRTSPEVQNCKTYQEETSDAAIVGECETAATGYTLNNKIPTNAATSDGTEFGHDPFSCKPASLTLNGANWECAASGCYSSYIFNSVSQKCEKITDYIDYCVQAAFVGTDRICSKCQAGYKLLVDPTAAGTPTRNLNEQCHDILSPDNTPSCGGNYICANQDISVTFNNANLNGGVSSVTLAVTGCGATGYSFANGRCSATNVLIPNCAQFNDQSGVCQSCSAGYILIQTTLITDAQNVGINLSRGDLFRLRCVKQIPNCKDYNGNTGLCNGCNKDPTTNQQLYKDDVGNACIDETAQYSSGCSVYELGNANVCIKCQQGRGLPADGCKLNPICQSYANSDFPDLCTECPTGYVMNYKFECIQDVLGLLSGSCQVAYNSTTCLNCDGGVQVTNQDNDQASDIGLCSASDQISNCVHISADGTKCYRCDTGYAWLNGACVLNENGPLQNCAQLEYDTDKKQLYCSECQLGFAIDGNFTTCISNTHNCTDVSGGSDCSLIKLLQPYSKTFECDSYRSSSLLVSFSMILALILSLIL